MERAGMRWTIKGAQSMLDIRSVYLNEHWDEFTQFRIEKINSELYPDHKIVEKFKWKIFEQLSLFNSDTFCKVSRLINICSFYYCHVIRKQLQGYGKYHGGN